MLHQVVDEESAADLAVKQLIEDEEREQARAAGRQAKKQQRKAKQKLTKHVKQSQDQSQHLESAEQNQESKSGVDASVSVHPQLDAMLQVTADAGYAHEPVASTQPECVLGMDPVAPATPDKQPNASCKEESDMDFLNKLACCPITQVIALALDGTWSSTVICDEEALSVTSR